MPPICQLRLNPETRTYAKSPHFGAIGARRANKVRALRLRGGGCWAQTGDPPASHRTGLRPAPGCAPHVANAARVAPLSVLTDCISFLLGSGLLRFAPVRERQYRERSPLSKPLIKASIETFDQFVDDLEPASPPNACWR
jgi:hypothetical protein